PACPPGWRPGTRRRARPVVPESGSWARRLRGAGLGDFDHAAAEAYLAVVEHHRLARGDGALRLVEHRAVAVLGLLQGADLVGLAVAHLGGQAARGGEVDRVDPVDVGGEQGAG